jgi:hypothetical protein
MAWNRLASATWRPTDGVDPHIVVPRGVPAAVLAIETQETAGCRCLIVDTRPPGAFAGGRIPHAINVHVPPELAERVSDAFIDDEAGGGLSLEQVSGALVCAPEDLRSDWLVPSGGASVATVPRALADV